MARVTLTSLKEENALLRMQNQNLTVENKRLLDIVENSDLVDFDFNYTVQMFVMLNLPLNLLVTKVRQSKF